MNYFRCGGGRSTHTATKITVAQTPLATFQSNASGLYLPEILAYFSATQEGSGDPSPNNPRVISGVTQVDTTRTGKNLINISEPVVISTGTTSNRLISTINVKAGITYTISCVQENSMTSNTRNTLNVEVDGTTTYEDVNTNYHLNSGVHSVTFTPSANGEAKVRFWGHTLSTETTYDKFQLELASTPSAYHAYTGTTATTALGMTCYGGYLNVPTGLLTVTNAIVDLGSLTWVYANNAFAATGLTGLVDYALKTNTPMICSNYNYLGTNSTGTAWFADKADKTCGSFFVSGNPNRAIYVKDTDYTDAVTFKSAMDGVQICYELATPQTVQLTPAQVTQLLGQNNVFCSTGDVAVKYWKID